MVNAWLQIWHNDGVIANKQKGRGHLIHSVKKKNPDFYFGKRTSEFHSPAKMVNTVNKFQLKTRIFKF